MYAVIEVKGHQYIVKKGDTIVVDKIEGNKGDKINIEEVLLAFDDKGEKVIVGSPYIQKAKVSAELLETKKGKKIGVLKFKRKNRYQRRIGFRPCETVLEIKKIEIDG
ncbi:MAG TPA: 50S ribosomal protein L21 [Candidatus Absconditabacterales bacterium]|nr:50S ribosomal protein L21 [Candidatus Absconditabacterales bacterium]HOQ79131.1 50S ribosomal protein L21 [Candidatus Absconditabacterales bacterium]HPK28214.1 50S ribosomal protein L21 [Candidatus Absconditabacterales bacterium]